MSHLDNMQLSFDLDQISYFLSDNMAFLMPLVTMILGILFAEKILQILVDTLLKLMGFVTGDKAKRPASEGFDTGSDFGSFDTDIGDVGDWFSSRKETRRKKPDHDRIDIDFDTDIGPEFGDTNEWYGPRKPERRPKDKRAPTYDRKPV